MTYETFTELVKAIEENPEVDTIKHSVMNPGGDVYVVPYCSKPEKGYGGVTLTKKEFKKLFRLYRNRFSFVDTGSYPVVSKERDNE